MALIDNLVSYYKFDINSATQVDSHGSNDGTVNGATFTGSGKINGAYSFDGSNDDISFTANDRTSNFTYNLWAKKNNGWHSQAGKNTFLEHTESNTGILIGYHSEPGKPSVYVWDGSSWNILVKSTTTTSDAWHMYTLTYDGTIVRYYIDGTEVDTWTGTPRTGLTAAFRIGRYAGQYTESTIDEFGLWDEAKSSNEVTELYNSGAGLQYPFGVAGTNLQINIADSWKEVNAMKINVGDAWKPVVGMKVNIGDAWKTVF